MPVVGDVAPTAETYYISSGALGAAYSQFVVLFDATDAPIGAWYRYNYSASTPNPSPLTGAGSFKTVTKNADGSLKLGTGPAYGSTSTTDLFIYNNLVRSSTAGTETVVGGTVTKDDGSTFTYNAFRQ